MHRTHLDGITCFTVSIVSKVEEQMLTADCIIHMSGYRLGQDEKEFFFRDLPFIYQEVKGEFPVHSGMGDDKYHRSQKQQKKIKKARKKGKKRRAAVLANLYDVDFFDAYRDQLFGMIGVLEERTLLAAIPLEELSEDEEQAIDILTDKEEELSDRYDEFRNAIVLTAWE
ncbi:MAG: hypothetical protein F6K50_47090 [Moorea sp. SIO3I7]|nr:hypothetical protein [Moorena sp. SIO3I7]NEO45334.1 hypothetical protein [Moorena sp. SIO4A3]